jgi:hypothetical protein
MSLWMIVLAPITVFATIAFFGTIGCAAILGIDDVSYATTPDGKPDYPGTIKKETSLVAYWRLGEAQPAKFPTTGGAANSETGLHNGDYFVLAAAPTDKARHSPHTAGTVTLGVQPGLLEFSPTSTGMQDDGGFVEVPFDDLLNPAQFTLECWINPDIGTDDTNDPGNYYCVFETTGPPGPQGLGPKQTGVGLYIGPKDIPPKTPAGPYFWQVWMGDPNTKKLTQMAVSNDSVKFKQLTYLALTFDGDNLQLFLYYPDLPAGQRQNCDNINTIRTLQKNGIKFARNDTNGKTGTGPFFIGSGSNLYPGAGVPKQRLYPFKGKIQEVALYNIDLSAPNNQGCGKLIGHESAGGNL